MTYIFVIISWCVEVIALYPLLLSPVDQMNFGVQGNASFLTSTQADKPLDEDLSSTTREHSGPIRARSRSLVRSIKKLTRSISCSGSIPRLVDFYTY